MGARSRKKGKHIKIGKGREIYIPPPTIGHSRWCIGEGLGSVIVDFSGHTVTIFRAHSGEKLLSQASLSAAIEWLYDNFAANPSS